MMYVKTIGYIQVIVLIDWNYIKRIVYRQINEPIVNLFKVS